MRSIVLDQDFRLADPERFALLESAVRAHLAHLSDFYPEFEKWYSTRVSDGILSGERKILIRTINDQIGAIAIVKRTVDERKLCCLRVSPGLQGTGIGIHMFGDAFDVLETDKPLLSVAEEQLPNFHKIFEHFSFEIGGEYAGLYRENSSELSFNGLLITQK